MKKLIAFLILLELSSTAWCQKSNLATNEFVISGEVKKELKFTLADIEKYPSKKIGDISITNHLGEPRGIAK